MNKISDRRKIHGHSQVNTQQQGNLLRMTTSGIVNNLPLSAQQLKKIIKQMEQVLKQERYKRTQLQQNIKLLQYRGIEKQKQFLKILRQKSKQVYRYSKPTEDSDNLDDIRAVYNNIVSNFQLTSNLTNALIQKKYQQNQSAMQRRIGSILIVLDQQIRRCRQMSSQNLQAIKTQVQRALYIIKGIQTQNIQLMQKYQKEKSKTKILQQQRKLLLQQLVHKKMLIVKLYQITKKQNKEHKLTLQQQNQIKSKSTHKYNSYLEQQELKTAKKKLKTLQSCNQTEARNAFSTNNIRDLSQKGSLQKQDYNRRNSVKFEQNQFTIKLQKQQSEFVSKLQPTLQHRNYKKVSNPENQQEKFGLNNKKNYLNLQKKYGKNSRNKNSLLITSHQSQMSKIKFRNDSEKKNMISCSIPLNESNQKIIRHLKHCLQREKKKSYELGKIISKIQSKELEINESILNILNQNKQKHIESGQSPQNTIKIQGLYRLIKDLQNRLSMCEHPTINCGFGQLEVNKLLQES